MFFWLPYFRTKSFGFFGIRLLVCFRVTPSQLLIRFSFVFFLESPVLSVSFYPFVDISLIFLLSPALSGLFPQVVLLFFLCCLFLVVPAYISASLFLSFWLVFVVLLFAFPVEFPIPGLTVFFVLFVGIPIFSQTNFEPA